MSDATPQPDRTEEFAGAASGPSTAPADQPGPRTTRWWNRRTTRPAGAHWWNRRVPLLLTAAALLLGCVLGGGVVAVGALVGDGHHGDGRGHSRDERAGGRGDEHGRNHRPRRGDDDDQSTPAPSTPAPSAPAPSAS